MEKDSCALDQLEERHRDEVAREAATHVRHAPRPLRFLRPPEQPESDALRTRLGAPAVFADPLRSAGAWLATPDLAPSCSLDVGAPFGGHAPLPLVRGYMEGDFGATLVGEHAEEAATELRARLHRLAPALPHVELFADAGDARAELASRLRARRPGPILVVGELHEVAALGPHRVSPSPPPRLDAPMTLDELQAAALSALEHAIDEQPTSAVWIVALDAAGRAASETFIEASAEVARARGVPSVVDEAAFALHAAGRELAGGNTLPVEARVLGGPALPGIVLAQRPVSVEQGVVEPAALVRARLLLDAHDPAFATRAQVWLVSRLEALTDRFPDLVLAPRAAGYVFGFELPTVGHRENLSAQLPLRGAHLPAPPPGHPRTVIGRLGLTWTVPEVDRLFDALQGALRWLEAHVDTHGVGPSPRADDVPVGTSTERAPKRAVETRVRLVTPEDADALLDAMVALEERVYEPARRDPREKLALAFHDPAGVVAVAEVREGDAWKVVGGALAAPLERIRGVAGCDDDPLRGDRVSLYSIGTTLDPECRGLGLGEQLKTAVMEGAASIRRSDGSHRFHWVCGRMRVGATDAMARINRRLGASEVRRLRGQYEGSAEASYYRMPVRGFVPRDAEPRGAHEPDRREPTLLHRPERWLDSPPEGLRAAAEVGLLFGPAVHGLQPSADRASPASLRALEVLRALHPDQPHVRLAGSRRLALHACAEALAAEVVALVGDDVADLNARRLPHPADDPRAALDALAKSPRSVLFLERVQARTGRVVPQTFLDDLRERGARFVAVERATSGFRHPIATVEGALALVWGEGPLGVVHARDPQPVGTAGDELSLVRATYALRATRALRLCGHVDERRLDEALSSAASLGIWRGEGHYRVLETPSAGKLVALLRGHGFVLRARGEHVAFAPPLDLPDERYAALRSALRRASR